MTCSVVTCQQPMEEDLVFARDCAYYGVGRRHFICVVCGHSEYMDYTLPEGRGLTRGFYGRALRPGEACSRCQIRRHAKRHVWCTWCQTEAKRASRAGARA